MLRPRDHPQDHYRTSPIQAPELPETVTYKPGHTMPTREALPIARAVLMAAFVALKQQIPSGKRTIYNLERACYHLRRVTIRHAPKPDKHDSAG